MTTDLWYLAASVALTWAFIMVAATPGMFTHGIGWAFGNREHHPELEGASGRAKRLAANMNENLPLITALVLLAHVSGKAGDLSAMGAMVFFYGRVGHAVCYLAGVHVVRTLSWGVSVAGMFMIGASLFA